jgi:hypothetical protein
VNETYTFRCLEKVLKNKSKHKAETVDFYLKYCFEETEMSIGLDSDCMDNRS